MSLKEGREMPFILIKAKDRSNLSALCKKIEKDTGLSAFTKKDLMRLMSNRFVQKTGLSSHFSWVVLFGFILSIGIIGASLFALCDGIKKDLSIFKSIGASKYTCSQWGFTNPF